MNYKEYENALNAILKAKEIIRTEAFASKGQKKEDAAEAIKLLLNTQELLNNLYGGTYDD